MSYWPDGLSCLSSYSVTDLKMSHGLSHLFLTDGKRHERRWFNKSPIRAYPPFWPEVVRFSPGYVIMMTTVQIRDDEGSFRDVISGDGGITGSHVGQRQSGWNIISTFFLWLWHARPPDISMWIITTTKRRVIYIPLPLPWLQGSWGQHGAYLGPTGPRWAPCWPHELCYLGIF